ncbi:PucR family transcriptional regulator [Mycobacterium riyadhense]|uniref:Transcriptional regulator n=1 Tax=Mycobacterium riyadhense TaxID=486698 RepID=A0A1X2CQ33_9MYCO|nr:PucR family transcriptional regulator [Mycobacterium riyadhense]MCV7145697.1 PucR family transcriptional regulator [Mycobacterium riyadhense]ORW77932.1 transcriptional regulator [Mycobacterium riyadhense]
MALRPPSPRVQELIRKAAWMALNPSREWLEEFDRVTLAANAAISQDPGLAAVVTRSNRANLVYFASAMLRTPGDPVPPNLSAHTLRMARDLVRRGLDASALEVYRIGHNVAWRRWTEIAFELTSDPEELHELLDVPFRSANEFVDATLAGIAEQMQAEYDELTQDIGAERRKIVELILDNAPLSRERAEARLGCLFDRPHTAAIIWHDEPDSDPTGLDEAVDLFSQAVGCPRPLTVMASAATRWIWVKDVAALTPEQIREVLDKTPDVRIAIGSTAPGIEGFRRSHFDALTTQRMMARLRSRQRIAFFTDVQMVTLLTENPYGADDFIRTTLGDFESASPMLHTTVLTFIKAGCNASRAAKLLYTHRNTVLHRLETAQRLLPRPLDHTSVEVAVAIEALQWRGKRTSPVAECPAEQQSVSAGPR